MFFWPIYQRRVPVLCEDGGGGDGEEDPQDREADRDDGEHGGPPHVLFKQEQTLCNDLRHFQELQNKTQKNLLRDPTPKRNLVREQEILILD